MSKEPIRYECTDEGMKIYGSGSFVLYSDYSTLRAQLAERNKENAYADYDFCKSINCVAFHKGKCLPTNCHYTTKQFHKWLEENGYSIVQKQKGVIVK